MKTFNEIRGGIQREATADVSFYLGHTHAKRAGIDVKVHHSSIGGHGDEVTLSHPDKNKLQKYVDRHLGGAEQGVHVKESEGLTSTRESTINESTNWKGSKSIDLTRYAARQGFGVQLTQVKAMPGEKIPVTGLGRDPDLY